jgi:hypothetical protein
MILDPRGTGRLVGGVTSAAGRRDRDSASHDYPAQLTILDLDLKAIAFTTNI